MSDPTTAAVHIDGAARGNPGPAAYALVLRRPGLPPIEEAEPIGKATNNVAEYTALVRALEVAAEAGVRELTVFSDSELLVKQMNGEYRVKNADLQDLYAEAQQLRKRFDRVTLSHVRRAQNPDADRLCNEALDGRPRRRGGQNPSPGSEGENDEDTAITPLSPPSLLGKGAGGLGSSSPAPESLTEEAVALLNAAFKAWAAGRQSPLAVDVWDRLWAMLGEHGILKTNGRRKPAGGSP